MKQLVGEKSLARACTVLSSPADLGCGFEELPVLVGQLVTGTTAVQSNPSTPSNTLLHKMVSTEDPLPRHQAVLSLLKYS